MGFLGVGKFKSKVGSKHTKSYLAWRSMLNRVYGKDYHAYGRYLGTVDGVCEDWKDFQNFAQWFENVSSGLDTSIPYEVDKDLSRGKLYSPETCFLLPHKLNTALITEVSTKGDCPTGVQRNSSGTFRSQLNRKGLGKPKYHGNGFLTAESAHKDYLKAKGDYLLEILKYCKDLGQIQEGVEEALQEWVKGLSATELSNNES